MDIRLSLEHLFLFLFASLTASSHSAALSSKTSVRERRKLSDDPNSSKSRHFPGSKDFYSEFDFDQKTEAHEGGAVESIPEARTRKLPGAIIIGVKKGGTRALVEYLKLNPLVKAPGPEVHFFDRHYDRGIEWYRRQMPLTTSEELTVEKTPSYFITKAAPERIYQMNPGVKLLVVVRDPVTRAVSDYTQTASKRPGMPSFEEMAFNKTNGRVNTSWGAVKIGIYHRHVKRWLRYFPLEQIHFVNGERLISHPAEEVREAEGFLGLPRVITRDHFQLNTTKGFPCIIRHHSAQPHCLGKTKGRPHPSVSPEVMDKLRAFYLTQNDRFYRMVGQKFGW